MRQLILAMLRSASALVGLLWLAVAQAGGGPLGIDHAWNYDNSGIWKRSNQTLLEDLTLATVVGGALWEGGESKLGRTYWQAVDSSALEMVSATALKYAFTRERPTQTNDPNQWFKGHGHYSFPSGEVAFISAAVTPFVLEYGQEHPAVYALEVLPAYDAIARMKVKAHWQTDVLAGFALGTATGYLASKRESPFILSVLPGGFMVGIGRSW
jgi:membrane-associated phospholipid phosphatase